MKTQKQQTSSSSLYEEVIQDVAAYKQAALEEAKKSVISNLIPVLEKEIERSLNEEFLNEADDLNLDAPPTAALGSDPMLAQPPSAPAPDLGTPPAADPTMAPPSQPTAPPAMPPALTPSAPIPTPAGSVLGQVPLPGPDGMITVNLSALYNSTSPENPTVDLTGGPALTGAPEGATTDQVDPATNLGGFPTDGDMSPVGEETPPSTPTTDTEQQSPPTENPFGESYDFASFKESIDELQARVGLVSEIKQPTPLQNKFLQTYSGLKFLASKGAVSQKISSLYESKLETLYSELEENINTYNSIQENQGNKMSRVTRELLKILSENSEAKGHAGFGDGESAPKGKKELDTGNAAGKHAMKTSDSDPQDPGKKDSLTTGSAAGYLEEEAEALELEAALKEMFGDEDDSGSEPMEEAAEVVADKVAKNMPAVKPGKPVNTNAVAVMEAKKKIKEKLKNLKKESAQLAKAIQECNQSMMADEAPVMGDSSSVVDTGKGVTVTINISGPGLDGAGDAATGLDAVHTEPDGDEGDDFDFAASDDDDDTSFEITDDDDDSTTDDLPETTDDDDTEEDEAPAMGESALKKENARLKESVAEMQLLAARSLYLNKLMALEGVSVSQKRKMAGYMDNVKTIAEAKETYFKIKEVLDENLATRKASTVRGSSSSATTKASSSVVKESKETAEGSTESNPIRDRWMILAGITK